MAHPSKTKQKSVRETEIQQNPRDKDLEKEAVSFEEVLSQFSIPGFGPVKNNRQINNKGEDSTVSNQSFNDSLDLSNFKIQNNQFNTTQKRGISIFRPEIISLIDYESVFQPGGREFSNTGKLLDVVGRTENLKKQQMISIFNHINESESSETKQVLTDMRSKSFRTILQTQEAIDSFIDIISRVEEMRNVFDIKNIPNSSYNTNEFFTLKQFFERYMQFSPRQFEENFSNTKVFFQFLFDISQIFKKHSNSIFNIIDQDRRNSDASPVKIDNSYASQDQFQFSSDILRSNNEIINASEKSFFNDIMNSLPNNSDERIMILNHLIAREYQFSRAMGTPEVQDLLNNKFGVDSIGNPFDVIFGRVGNSIYEIPTGENSIASLGIFDVNDITVLPFEKQNIIDNEDNNQKKFVSGARYFIDTILDINNDQFNTKPFNDYVDRFSDRINDSINVLRKLSDTEENFRGPGSFTNSQIYFQFFQDFSSYFHNNFIFNESFAEDKSTPIISAIWKLSSDDPVLNNLLFQHCLLYGLSSNSEQQNIPIFRRLANEIGIIDNFPDVDSSLSVNPDLSGGIESLKPFLDQSAENIINRIVNLAKSDEDIRNIILNEELTQENLDSISEQEFAYRTMSSEDDEFNSNIAVFMKKEEILESLTNISLNSDRSLFSMFVFMARKLTRNHLSSMLIDDQSGRTRFNLMSISTQLLLIYEYIRTFIPKYMSGIRILTTGDLNVGIGAAIDSDELRFIKRSVDSVLRRIHDQRGQNLTASNVAVRNQSIFDKLKEEDFIIDNSIHILTVINQHLTNAKSNIQQSFNSETFERIRNHLQDDESLELLQYPHQIRINKYLLETVKQNTRNEINDQNLNLGHFITKFPMTESVLNAIYSYLSVIGSGFALSDFESTLTKLKIMSVGIPFGFVDNIQDFVKKSEFNAGSIESKNFDIVNVKVYKRDNRFPELVFKPFEIKFDLSLFQNLQLLDQAKAEPGDYYFNLENRLRVFEISNSNNITPVSLEDLQEDERYSKFSRREIENIFENTIRSLIYSQYIRLVTGFSITEEQFPQQEIRNFHNVDTNVQNLILLYLNDILGKEVPQQSFEELLNNPQVDRQSKDIIRTVSLGGGLFNTGHIRDKILKPKMFDRVLHFIFDPIRNFELDIETTESTESGRRALNQNQIQNQLEEIPNQGTFLRARESTQEYVFDDYFVTIETVL